MGLAMEAAYSISRGEDKSYQQLMADFMLRPTPESQAHGSVANFENTRFATDIKEGDNVVKAKYVEQNQAGQAVAVDANNFNGAGAAGSMFSSANDSVRQYFKGFLGTPEHGQEGVNPFFSKATIDEMQQEWQRHAPANQGDIDTAIAEQKPVPNRRFQGPGFTVDLDAQNKPIAYVKTGGVYGYDSKMTFEPESGDVNISMTHKNNLELLKHKTADDLSVAKPAAAQVASEPKPLGKFTEQHPKKQPEQSFASAIAEKPRKPLIIYIAETNHGDLSYSSFLKQIIEDCAKKGLKVKVFSEFGNKDLKSQDERFLTRPASELSNIPDDPEIHAATTAILNERSIPMGNLFERFNKLIPDVLQGLPQDITPSGFLEQIRQFIDNRETLRLLDAEIAIRKENQSKGIGGDGSGNSAGKDGADFKSFWGNGNAFVQRTVHQTMAQDVISNIKWR